MTDNQEILPQPNTNFVPTKNKGAWNFLKRTTCFIGSTIVCLPLICGLISLACQPVFVLICGMVTNGSSHDIALDINFALTCLVFSSLIFGSIFPFRSLSEAGIRATSCFLLLFWWFPALLQPLILLSSMCIFA